MGIDGPFHQADPVSFTGEGHGQIDRDSGLAHSALAGSYGDDLADALKLGVVQVIDRLFGGLALPHQLDDRDLGMRELGGQSLLAFLLNRSQKGIGRGYHQLKAYQHGLLSGLRIRRLDGSPVPVEELDVLDETQGYDIFLRRRMNDL